MHFLYMYTNDSQTLHINNRKSNCPLRYIVEKLTILHTCTEFAHVDFDANSNRRQEVATDHVYTSWCFNSFTPTKIVNIYFLLEIPVQNMFIRIEN